jgi:hypothetical protein
MAQHQGQREAGTGFGSTLLRVGGIGVLLVLAVVAARARAAGDLPHVSGGLGSVVLGIIRMVGVGVVTSGLVLLIWAGKQRRKRMAGRPGQRKKLNQAQRRRVWSAVLIGTAVAIAYQILMRLFGPDPQQKQQMPQQQPGAPANGQGTAQQGQPGGPHEAGWGTYITILVALLALIALAVVLLRRGEDIDVDAEVQDEDEVQDETVARAVVAGRAAVRDRTITDPREAIVACFAAMEQALAGVGGDVTPRAADTPQEVLRRGVAGARLPEKPATELLGLFRVARFSKHPVRESDRDNADRALEAILRALGVTEESAR